MKDNQHFRTLSQSLDQLNDQKITTNDSHISTGSDSGLKSSLNDQKSRQKRLKTQEVIESNEDTISEDSDESYVKSIRTLAKNKRKYTKRQPKVSTKAKTKQSISLSKPLKDKTLKTETITTDDSNGDNDYTIESDVKPKRTQKKKCVVPLTTILSTTSGLNLCRDNIKKCLDLSTNSYKCPETGCLFSSAKQYLLFCHMYSVHTERRIKCTHEGCDKRFIKPSKLSAHLIVHSKDRPKRTQRTTSMVPFKTILTTTSGLNLCRENIEKCRDLATNSYKCPETGCQKFTAKPYAMYKHLYQKHTHRRIKCTHDGCDKHFTAMWIMTRHLATHSDEKSFKCDYSECQHSCRSAAALRLHVTDRHSTDQPLRCHYAGCRVAHKTYGSKNAYEQHLLTHKAEPTFRCGTDGCDHMFFTRGKRIRHQIEAHNRIPNTRRKYRCDWPGCEWMGENIQDHKRDHLGIKQWPCLWPDCGMKFKARVNFEDHMNIHNNVKPHSCHWPGCDFRAYVRTSVKKHINRKHKK
ncbi:unnamed protein product [Medioppia subpectinata]|uniref:C2H2-type domain-containing protein n=1 Tax=Medioppia subpectinata TaxID=1979941 RepID=A0A7R9L688_9ACAR|nr:unnamed protein product [Medioppia subpectinata]CAG2115256.1 unnamed protein product [Medioppia subpectinata]